MLLQSSRSVYVESKRVISFRVRLPGLNGCIYSFNKPASRSSSTARPYIVAVISAADLLVYCARQDWLNSDTGSAASVADLLRGCSAAVHRPVSSRVAEIDCIDRRELLSPERQ